VLVAAGVVAGVVAGGGGEVWAILVCVEAIVRCELSCLS
jgi:hypothetical protein